MAQVDLTGVFAKLGRAKTYASELQDRVTTQLDSSDHSFTFEFNPKVGKHALVVHDLPVVDPEWALLVGEVVFHLRSCLDHLAWQIAIFDGKTPGEHTYYPIRDSPYDKKGSLRPTQITPAISSPEILNALEETQPYRALKTSIPGTSQIELTAVPRNSMRSIRVLNNIDKHRLLLVTAVVLDAGEMWWGLPVDFPSPSYILNPGELKNDEPVAWFDFGGRESPSEFDPHPAVRISLREPEVAFLTVVPMAQYLNTLCDFWVKEWILEWRFVPIFEGDPPLF